MTAPATIMLAKIFIPETGKPATAGRVDIKVEKTAVNVIDAAAQGAGDGLQLALNIGGMLIAFLALIAMCNGILGWLHTLPLLGWLPASLERVFGILFAPVAWMLGVPWKDCGGHRQPAGHAPGVERIRGVPEARADESAARSAIVHHRDLRAVRVCEFQFDRDSDRRHRRAGAHPQERSGAARTARRGRRNHGELHVGLHRGNVAVTDEAKRYIQGHTDVRPEIGLVLGSGLGAFADELTDRTESRTPKFPAGRIPPPWATRASWLSASWATLDVAVMAGRAHAYEGYCDAAGDVRRARAAIDRRAVHGVHQRGGRHQSGAGTRRSGADQRPHQPARRESAGGAERRLAGSALPRYVGGLFADVSRDREGGGRRTGHSDDGRRVRGDAGPELRDARRRSAICAPSARTWWGCPPCPK